MFAKVKPPRSRVAPAVTEVPAAVVPSGVLVTPPAAPSFNIPALMVVNPVKVFAPDNINVPVPLFVIPQKKHYVLVV